MTEAGNRESKGREESWQKEFVRLRQFVEFSGDVKVTPQSLAVPGERKAEFYRLVENVQMALGTEVLGGCQEQGIGLAGEFQRMRRQMIGETNLKKFCLASAMENLVENPGLTMAEPAFGIVLDGLQQELSFEEMEERAKKQVVPFCKDLLRNLYEAWLYYGIVAALKPVRFYGVYSPDMVTMEAVDTDMVTVGYQAASPERRMPEAVFVTRDNRVFAMKSEVAEELDFYGERPGGCRDCSAGGNTVDQIAHRILLLYAMESVEKVPLLANREKRYLLPNDLMCEFLLPEDMERPWRAAKFAGRISTVRSRRPVQVLTWDERGRFPDGFFQEPFMVPVDRRTVGNDGEKLKEIAGILQD